MALAVAAGSLAAGGCGVFGGIFGGDEESDARQPRELSEISEQFRIRRVWSARVGDGGDELRLALRLDGDGSRIYAANADGVVHAFEAGNGRQRWRRDTGLSLSAGPVVGDGVVAVGSSGGWIAVLDADSGIEQWRAYVNGEVLAAPAIGGGRLFVRTVHGFLYAFSLATGQELWSVSQSMPRLSLRGTSAPVLQGQMVICGFDNGRLTAYQQSDGARAWDVSPHRDRSRSLARPAAGYPGSPRSLGCPVAWLPFLPFGAACTCRRAARGHTATLWRVAHTGR
jgi:outer membrane protein assembly factor BamB